MVKHKWNSKIPAFGDLKGWKEADRRLAQRFSDYLQSDDRSAANVTAEFLVKDELITASQGTMIPQSAEGMVANMVKNKVDIDNLYVSDLALYARPKDCLRLISMHGAKGLEFDAVAIVDLHEGRVPDFRAIRDGNEEAIEEDKRQLYVAMTRPRKLLMYFTDSSHYRNQPSRFLKEIGVF